MLYDYLCFVLELRGVFDLKYFIENLLIYFFFVRIIVQLCFKDQWVEYVENEEFQNKFSEEYVWLKKGKEGCYYIIYYVCKVIEFVF